MMKRTFIIVLTLLLINQGTTLAQIPSITKEDYQRAASFSYENINNHLAYNLNLEVQFFSDSSGLYWVHHHEQGKEYLQWTKESREVVPLFDQKRLADALGQVLEDTISSQNLPIRAVDKMDNDSLLFTVKGKKYVMNLNNYEIKPKEGEPEDSNPYEVISPDGQWIAYVREYNLYVRSTTSDLIIPLTTDGKKGYEYATYYGWGDLMEGEQGDRPLRFTAQWSEDSKMILTQVVDFTKADKMYMLDFTGTDRFRPKLLSYYRGSPGDTTMIYVTPKLFSVPDQKELPLDLEPRTHINSPLIRSMKNMEELVVVDGKRGYKERAFYLFNTKGGKKQLLFEEKSTTNIPESRNIHLLPNRDQFLFLSERTGWQQLFRFDLVSKEIKALTTGAFMVHNVVEVDELEGVVYFMASGVDPNDNPYYRYLYKVSLDGGDMVCLTSSVGHHQVQLSPDHQYFVEAWSTNDQPTQYSLRQLKDGQLVTFMAKTNIDSLLKLNWKPAEAFTATGRDGETTIYGAIWKPTHFDPNKKYPVIDATYTGPHTQVFPESFVKNFYGPQQFAELGFVVVRVNGMGTYGRSKAFHDVSYKNMGQNLLDHVLAIRQLGERYTWVDTTRVGIFGHSAGGYDAAHGLLAFPDFYKVGVASSADHDFRMEKAWWPEFYMGWPVDSTYHEVSNITMAGNLKGKLMITHGAVDENVNASATFKLAEALINADKEFELVVFPSQRHGYRGKAQAYFTKKRWNFFVEHLLGAEPVWDWK